MDRSMGRFVLSASKLLYELGVHVAGPLDRLGVLIILRAVSAAVGNRNGDGIRVAGDGGVIVAGYFGTENGEVGNQ